MKIEKIIIQLHIQKHKSKLMNKIFNVIFKIKNFQNFWFYKINKNKKKYLN